ncbi:MAG: hypothetical protein Q8R16_01545, partial [bacterium]|nr:hypothetical protein [bacterium]
MISLAYNRRTTYPERRNVKGSDPMSCPQPFDSAQGIPDEPEKVRNQFPSGKMRMESWVRRLAGGAFALSGGDA